MLSPDEIRAKYSFYNLDDIVAGSLNTQDEGAFDALAMVEWLRRKAVGTASTTSRTRSSR